MAIKLDRDIRRVTVMEPGETGSRTVYRRGSDEDDRLPIKRVTVVKRDERGRTVARESYESERRSRRQSRGLRPIERSIRELLEFETRVLNNYLDRHQRSNEKSRDGWLSDLPSNVSRAVRKARPQRLVRVSRLLRDRD